MSIRQMFPGSIVKPGFNPLAAQTPTILYNLFSWGKGSSGQLGLGNTTSYSSSKQVGSAYWLSVAANYNASYGIKLDNTLWSWGSGAAGKLGLGNTTYYSSPKQVGALTNWLKIAAGWYSAVAIKTDGTLWSWGNGSDGQLGLGNTTSYSSPKQIGALTTWSYVGGGRGCYGAIKTDGTLWTWGRNDYGQLGNLAAGVNKSSPIQVGALTNWLSLTGGEYHFIARKTDGTLWAWGGNSNGQLGIGTVSTTDSPTQIGALTTWTSSGTSSRGGYAIKGGTLWSWGSNRYGALGLGNTTYYSSPKQIGALTTWSQVGQVSPSWFMFAIKTDGTLWSWGRNNEGQLGLGNITYGRSSPAQVGSSTTWLQVAGGNYHTVALG